MLTAWTSTVYTPLGSSLEMVKAWCQRLFSLSLQRLTIPVPVLLLMALALTSLAPVGAGPAAANMLVSRLPRLP